LHSDAHLANFVEKYGSATSLLYPALLVSVRVCEAASDMTEQLGLQQGIRNTGAIGWKEWRSSAAASAVNHAGNNLLADAALTHDQDLCVGLAGVLDFLLNLANCGTRSNELGTHYVTSNRGLND
jgi:hypothetical protein